MNVAVDKYSSEYIIGERFYRMLHSFGTSSCTIHENDALMKKAVAYLHTVDCKRILCFLERSASAWTQFLREHFINLQSFANHLLSEYAFNVESVYVFLLGDDVLSNGPYMSRMTTASMLSSYMMYYDTNTYHIVDLTIKGANTMDTTVSPPVVEFCSRTDKMRRVVSVDDSYLLTHDTIVVSLGLNDLRYRHSRPATQVCKVLARYATMVKMVIYILPYPTQNITPEAYIYFCGNMARYCKEKGIRIISLHDFKSTRHVNNNNCPTFEGAASISERIVRSLVTTKNTYIVENVSTSD